MNKSHFFIIFLSLLGLQASASIRDLETTRLQSTAGAGVASVLVNEASFLNPASIVFVPTSAFYYQRGSSTLNGDSDQRTSDFSDGSNEVYLLSDSSGQLKGTFSYQRQAENQYRRLRFTSSLAANYGKRSSFGLLYRYTTDEDIREDEEEKYHQVVLGMTHIFSEQFSFGATLVDPFLANKEDARFTAGIQYTLISNLILILDYGVNFNDDPNKNSVTKGALQINFFRDFFLRGGRFHDNITGLSGNAWGLSWIGPRLALEYAVKSSEVTQEKSDYFYEEEKLIESSLSLALIF